MDTIHNPTIFSGTRDKLNNICRLCFEVNDKDLIPIFSGDGLEHRIAEKINRYLPAISIKETDELPLKICYHCTSAIISWHQLTETSIQTDIKLKEIIKSSLDNEDIQDSSFFTLDNDTKVVAIPQNFLFRSDSSTSLLEDNDTNNSFSNHFESTEDETPIREEEEVNRKRKKKIKFMNWPKQDENEMNIIDENKEIKVENNVTEEIFIICDNCKILSEKLFENKERKYCEKCFEILVEPKNIDKYVIDIQGETYYECDKCKFKNKSKHILLKHLQRHNNRSFECDKCDRKFVLPYMLAMHKFRKHKLLTNNSENSCKICKQEFDTEEMLYKHETKIHVQCGECFKKFSTSSACEKHITKCKNSRTATIKDKKAPQQSSFQCDQCPYQTKRLYSFEIHYRKHTGEKPFECHECGNTFRIKGSLSMHILDVHQGQRKHVCETCGQSFSVKQNLVNHERLHTGEKPYVCDLCGKTFAQRSGLNTHKRIELGLKTHECKMCNKKFLKRSNLELHNTRKHSDVRSHMCNTCGKLFKDKRALSEHFTVHSDNRPFSCELCGNSFKLRKHLVQHYRVHNKKPIKSTQSDDVCTEEEKMNVQLNTKVEQPFLFIYNTFPQYHQLK